MTKCGRSPDLNPIETLWARLQALVSARGPNDTMQLQRFVQAEWNKIPQAEIDKLVLSYESRLDKCIAQEGAIIKP